MYFICMNEHSRLTSCICGKHVNIAIDMKQTMIKLKSGDYGGRHTFTKRQACSIYSREAGPEDAKCEYATLVASPPFS
jgi:hypothetical protein